MPADRTNLPLPVPSRPMALDLLAVVGLAVAAGLACGVTLGGVTLLFASQERAVATPAESGAPVHAPPAVEERRAAPPTQSGRRVLAHRPDIRAYT